MIIRKMSASFGRLENETLELHEGLNIISAPNESGKSTWCAFIRSMLYGIDSSQREKGGVKPDKVKYAPWSGAAMSGEMEIEHEGKSITLRRSTKSAAAPMREFSATYTGTADPVPGLKGTDAGETLTGMPRAVFESSVFVRQAGLPVSNSAELEKRINAIISSGDDDGGSFTDADTVLRAWLRKRRHNRSGAIPTVEGEIAQVRRSLDSAAAAVQERTELERELEFSREAEERAGEAAKAEAANRQKSLIDRVEALRDKLSSLEKAHAEAIEKHRQLKGETEVGPFAGRSPEEALRVANVDANKLNYFKESIPAPTTSFIVLAVAIGLMVAGYFLEFIVLSAIGFPLVFGAGVSFALIKGHKNRVKNFTRNLSEAYDMPLDDVSSESLIAKAEAYAAAATAAAEAEADCSRIAEDLENSREALRAAEENLLSSGGDSDESPALVRARADSAALSRQLSRKEGEISALGDPMVMATELEALESRHDELCQQYEALALAIETLREANDEMQQRFSPALGRRAGEIMAYLTGGKYAALSFSRELDATARRSEDAIAHEKAFLSQGTADQLYLALRLAICELALPEGCSCPIILDDALVNFDEERMGHALELLKELARERQIILFTCHDREKNYMANS